MKNTLVTVMIGLCVADCVAAQQVTTVPHLVRISNTFHPGNGQPAAPVEGVILCIYRDERDGAPLWQETQNVSVDSEGRYNVLLGATLNDGLPVELFTSGEPRWLGVRFNRPAELEQPRTLLTSVPYALRASDAETLGGLPASAFLRDPSVSSPPGVAAAVSATLTPHVPKPRATSGAAGYLGMFTDATDLGNSSLYQWGGSIGLNTTTPLDHFHVVFNDGTGAVTGYAVQNLNPAGFSGMLFYDQNGNLGEFQGFSNTTHEYRINNQASGGTINFLIGSSSKLQVMNNGDINLNGNLRYGGNVVLQLGQIDNIGLGASTLTANTIGSYNTAIGYGTLSGNTTGGNNTAVGYIALGGNLYGNNNTGVGDAALFDNNGSGNTALGLLALVNNSTGDNNIAIGAFAANKVSGTNSGNIHIGSEGAPADYGTIRIGGTASGDAIVQTSFFAAGIRGVTTGNNDAVPVVIDSNGQLGTVSSSRRYKEDIRDMGEASRGLMQLRPVTFRYQKPFADGSKPLQYGLIAEEVAEVYPDLVARSTDGQIETVKYQVLDSMLLNEVQRQQTEIQDLRQRIEQLEALIAGGSK